MNQLVCRSWIICFRACFFTETLSLLVHSLPTKEIDIPPEFKQCDCQCLFFLLIVEGLSTILKRVVSIEQFYGFEWHNDVAPHNVYYIMWLRETSFDNFSIIKVILRSFELHSGLKVNFSKSCINGVNVNGSFLELAENNFHCKVVHFPLGIQGLRWMLIW